MTVAPRTKLVDEAAALAPMMARMADAARRDPAVFCAFVLRHEETGLPVTLAPMHEEWQTILTNYNRAVLWTHTEAGKSSGVSVGRVLWEIGKNPNLRVLILAASAGQAKKIVKSIKNYIENSWAYRTVFSHIVPDRTETTGKWTEDSIIVRRSTIAKDPTVHAAGYGAQSVQGGRYDLIIIDDYLTAENTCTDRQRQKYYGWLKSTIEGRKTSSGRLWFIGNAWDPDDAMHRYAAEPHTFSKRFPVRNEETGELSWPEQWPHERIEAEIISRGPIEAPRSLFCKPITDADRRFKLSYILRALALGDGKELPFALSVVPAGYKTITGVDLAVSKRDSADETAFVTIAVDGRLGVGTQERQVLDVCGGKMGGPEIVAKLYEIHHRYNSLSMVESNASQVFLKQFAEERTAIPIRSFYTGRNKADPAFGVLSLATEMSAGKWSFPNMGGSERGIHARIHPELKKLINELLRYDPQSHTGDRLMAMWFAREGARFALRPSGSTRRTRR